MTRPTALLHNMSVPPRTQVQLSGRTVAATVTVYSLVHAVALAGLTEVPVDEDLVRQIPEAAPATIAAVRRSFPCPEDLFRRVGPPEYPALRYGFLLGWHPRAAHFPEIPRGPGASFPDRIELGPCRLCGDVRRCAGVLARTFGTLYLPDRAPDLSWDRLLAAPVAFDEPLFPPR